MKHIKTLTLNNFQQWKSGEIKFTPGLNILIGDTESGKSTLFRAIYSIITGKMPEDYIRKGTKGCEVKIEFTDGTVFRRLRNKKDNIADANGLIFERVGKEIPFEYFNRLGKTGITFGSKELSLCAYSQFEPHFFITLSDYDKSKLIGTICGIDIVDKILDLVNKDIRANNSNIKFVTEQIAAQKPEKELKSTEFKLMQEKADKLSSCYNSVADKYKTLENAVNLGQKLGLLKTDITIAENELGALKQRIGHFNKDLVEKLGKVYELKNSLITVSDSITATLKLEKEIITSNPVSVDRANLLDDLMFLREKLIDINKQIKDKTYDKTLAESELLNLENKKKELLKGYDKCPLCGGIL